MMGKNTYNQPKNPRWKSILGFVLIVIVITVFRQENKKRFKEFYVNQPDGVIVDWNINHGNDNPPKGWETYYIAKICQVSIPPTIEVRGDDDEYTKVLETISLASGLKRVINYGNIVFQQKGLSQREPSAYDKYCRIIIRTEYGDYGDFLKSTETAILDSEWMAALNELVQNNIGPAAQLMGNAMYKWSTINGSNCIQVDYKRTGFNFDSSRPVVCRIAIFQNNNKMVMMSLSYRENEADLWEADFDKVFKSFRWLSR